MATIIKIFHVIAESEVTEWDEDLVPYETYEVFYEDMFSTRVSAIRKAQRLSAKHWCYVRVIRELIGEQGKFSSKLIYVKPLKRRG